MRYKVKDKRGITLIALVVTVIILIILASVSISMLIGQNGILNRASETKIQSTLGNVKEQLRMYSLENNITSNTVITEILLAEGKVKRTVQQGEDGKYYIYYALKENTFNSMNGLGTGNIASLKDVFLIDDNLNIKYINNNGKGYGDNIDNKILEDETEIRFSNKAFSKYVSKISGVTEENMKFKWMKNQTNLTIGDSSIDSLEDLIFFPNLISLTIGDATHQSLAPKVETLNGVENCSKLENLTINYGIDKDYSSIKNLSNLKSFSRVSGTDYDNIISNLKNCSKLSHLSFLYAKDIKMKKLEELPNLDYLYMGHCEIKRIEGLDKMTNLKTLYLNYNEIKKIEGLTNARNLNFLNLSNNDINDITPLSVNQNLMSLWLNNNKNIDGNRENYIGEKMIALNKVGEILDRGGSIYLDYDKLGLFTNYTSLSLNNNNISTLDALEGLTKIKNLSFRQNKLTLEDVKSQNILKSLTELETLDLTNNKITDISVINNLKNLKLLQLSGNENINLKQIEDIISNLNGLEVSNDVLQTITNCDNTKITKISITGANYTTLPNLANFTNLENLSLTYKTNVTNFDVISKISSLKLLYLSNDNLHGRMINFSNLTNLTVLDLSNNNLWSEDLENLKALRNNNNLSIDLSKNSIINGDALLALNSNTKINLKENVNLSQDSKNKLKEKFGNNVTFK